MQTCMHPGCKAPATRIAFDTIHKTLNHVCPDHIGSMRDIGPYPVGRATKHSPRAITGNLQPALKRRFTDAELIAEAIEDLCLAILHEPHRQLDARRALVAVLTD